ncbi:MAG: AbrB/MazE/SpoVT family DNA-binding domain-containing protein [Thaumarchaeota archaeon]|nr:AbrB/MazE/SpoVT family DNA-binding domain-containing protein [Nitrososphaerota archaeon]
MEVRKLQTTAAGTFIVTIPKEWAQALSLKKGDLVNVEMEDNDIVVSSTTTKQNPPSKSLFVEEFKDQKLLELCITASYIQGHDITEIRSKAKMAIDQKRWIRQAVEGLVGVEIAEDYADKMVLQNLIDPFKFDINSLLEKFASISRAVLQDAIRALIERDLSLAQDAFERGEQSTKLYRLIMRLSLQAARSRKIRDQMNLSDISSVVIKIIATRELGRMAYYAMRIAQHVSEVEKKLDEETASMVQKMTRISVEMQDHALKALLQKDLAMASTIIDRMVQVRRLYEAALPLITKLDDRLSLALSLIIRDIRAYAGYAVALADDAVLGVFDI